MDKAHFAESREMLVRDRLKHRHVPSENKRICPRDMAEAENRRMTYLHAHKAAAQTLALASCKVSERVFVNEDFRSIIENLNNPRQSLEVFSAQSLQGQ
jgi:hypothetical protein